MANDRSKPTIAMVLSPEPGFPGDPWVRLRRALKALLRTYGLRNRLFIDPATLDASSGQWREVRPATDVDASHQEPPF